MVKNHFNHNPVLLLRVCLVRGTRVSVLWIPPKVMILDRLDRIILCKNLNHCAPSFPTTKHNLILNSLEFNKIITIGCCISDAD